MGFTGRWEGYRAFLVLCVLATTALVGVSIMPCILGQPIRHADGMPGRRGPRAPGEPLKRPGQRPVHGVQFWSVHVPLLLESRSMSDDPLERRAVARSIAPKSAASAVPFSRASRPCPEGKHRSAPGISVCCCLAGYRVVTTDFFKSRECRPAVALFFCFSFFRMDDRKGLSLPLPSKFVFRRHLRRAVFLAVIYSRIVPCRCCLLSS